jgi:hypothetical protein
MLEAIEREFEAATKGLEELKANDSTGDKDDDEHGNYSSPYSSILYILFCCILSQLCFHVLLQLQGEKLCLKLLNASLKVL